MRRIITLVVVALVMAAIMLTVTVPAIAQSQVRPCYDFPGQRPAPNAVVPGPRAVLFNCVDPGEPGEPPSLVKLA